MKVVSALALACLVVGASAIDGAETRANRGGVIEIPRGPTAWTSRRAGPAAGLPARRDSPRDHHDDSRSASVGISSVSAPVDVSNEAVPSKTLIYDPDTGTVVQQRILHMPSTLSVANPGWWAGIPADKLKIATEVQPAAEEPAAEEPAAEEPAAEQPAAKEPVVVEPATEEPAAEKPATEEPVAEEPVAEEPAAEKPAAEKPATAKPEHKTAHRRSARGDNNLVYQKDASGRLTAAPAVDEPTSEAVTDASIPTEANPSKPAAADTTKAQTPADKQSSNASGTATDSDEKRDEQTHSSADKSTKAEDVSGAAEGPQDPAAADSTTAKPVGNSTAPAQTEKPAAEAKQQPPVAAEQQPAAATKGATEQQPAAAAAPTKEQQPAAAAEPAKEQKQANADSGAAVVPAPAPAPAQQQATTGEPAAVAADVAKPAAATPTAQPVTAPAANTSAPSTKPANDSTASSAPTKAEQPAPTATAPTEMVATPDTPAANVSAPTVHISNAEEVVGSTIDAYMAEPAAARSAAEPRKRVVAQRKRQGVLRPGQMKSGQASPKRETTGGVFSIQSIHMASDPAVLMNAQEPKVVDVNPVPAVEQPAAAAAPKAAAEPAAAPQNVSKTAATPDVPQTTDESRMRVAAATQSAAAPAAALPAAPHTEQPQTAAAPAAAATPKPAAAKPQQVPPAAGSIRLPNGMEVPANTFAMAGDSLLQGSSFFSKLAAYQATVNQSTAAAPIQSAPTVGGWQPAPITEAPAPAAQASSPAAAPSEQTNTLPTQTTQTEPAAPATEAKPAAATTPEAPAAADAAVGLLLGTSGSTPVMSSTPSTPTTTISKPEQTPSETPAASPAQPAAAAAADAHADADNDVNDQPVVSAPAPAKPVHNSQPISTPASTVTVAEEPSDVDASSEDDVIAIPSFGSQQETEEPQAREALPTEEPAREGLPIEEPAQKEWLAGGTAPVAAAAADAPSKHRETPRRGRPSAPVKLTPSRCGAGPDDSCEVANLCTARDGCQCQYSAGKKVDGVRLGTCGCSAAKGLATFSDNGISSCGWDVNFGQTKYYEVPRLGTVDLPVILGKNGVCPETGRNVIQTVNVDGASPMTCPRDADFVRLTYKRSGRWDSESCTSGRGNYVLRTTSRNAARGDCYAVPITTTDGKKHAIVFKYY